MPAPKSILTAPDLAEELGKSLWFVYHHLGDDDRLPPHFYSGRSLRFDRRELEKWMERRTREAAVAS